MELNDLYGLYFPSQLQLLLSYEIRSELSHISTLDDFDIDENYEQESGSLWTQWVQFRLLSLFPLNVNQSHYLFIRDLQK